MNRSFIRSTMLRAAFVAVTVTATGCSSQYTTGNSSTVLFLIADINGGKPLQSDVLTKGVVVADNAPVLVVVRFKNPNVETIPSVPSAVIVDHYEVRYRRSDGRGVEGQDVPFTISGLVTTAVDVATTGGTTLNVEVVRAQAKLEPPLRNLRGATTDTLGGALVLTVFAEITIYGKTISGTPVTAVGNLQIDFADYGSST
ncbi:MAG: hypothetical protein ABI672_13125 [Vicinamibacteria bacterium]